MRLVLISANKGVRARNREPYLVCRRCAADDIKPGSNKKADPESKPPAETEVTKLTRAKVTTPERAVRPSHPPRPPDPLTCCGTGCANCVWIEYGIQLMHYYDDRPLEEALGEIDKQVSNIGIREFVKAEIRARAKYRK